MPPSSEGTQMRSRIFRQTIPIGEARAIPLPTKLVKYDGKGTSRYAVNPAVLP